MCPTFANTVSPMKCHFPTSHTCMPDFMFLYGGIVGQDFENIPIEEKDVLLAVEVSESQKSQGEGKTNTRSSQDQRLFCCYEGK